MTEKKGLDSDCDVQAEVDHEKKPGHYGLAAHTSQAIILGVDVGDRGKTTCIAAFDALPTWVAVGKNKQAGYTWHDADGWHCMCARGRLDFDNLQECEEAIAKWPAKATPLNRAPRVKPLDPKWLTNSASGFAVMDKNGRELGGCGESPRLRRLRVRRIDGQFADAASADAAIVKAARRIDAERRKARKAAKAEAAP